MPRKLEKKREARLRVCPNCGRKLASLDFLPNAEKLPQNLILNFDPIANRFLCPDCNYSGLPILVRKEDYPKITFKNDTLSSPLERANPAYYKPLAYFLLLFFAFMLLEGTNPQDFLANLLLLLLLIAQVILMLYVIYLFLKKTSIYKK
ncbi:MAG: hypothetical protein PHS02_03585 [Candidatus ainarchaeum sp.]|nr:hypothetical protein [Candidatus ainarchaeum sp.]